MEVLWMSLAENGVMWMISVLAENDGDGIMCTGYIIVKGKGMVRVGAS